MAAHHWAVLEPPLGAVCAARRQPGQPHPFVAALPRRCVISSLHAVLLFPALF
jgi:hypothetical protein